MRQRDPILFLRTTVHTFCVRERHSACSWGGTVHTSYPDTLSVLKDNGPYFLCEAATLCSWGPRFIFPMWGSDTLSVLKDNGPYFLCEAATLCLFLRTTVHTSDVRQRHSILEDDGPYFLCKAATLCLFLRKTIHNYLQCEVAPVCLYLRQTIHTSCAKQPHSVCFLEEKRSFFFYLRQLYSVYSWGTRSIFPMWGGAILSVLKEKGPKFLCQAVLLCSWGKRSIFPMWNGITLFVLEWNDLSFLFEAAPPSVLKENNSSFRCEVAPFSLFMRKTAHTSDVRQRHSVCSWGKRPILPVSGGATLPLLEENDPYFLCEATLLCLFLKKTIHISYVKQHYSVCSWRKRSIFPMWSNTTLSVLEENHPSFLLRRSHSVRSWGKRSIFPKWGSATLSVLEENHPSFLLRRSHSVRSWGKRSIFPKWGSATLSVLEENDRYFLCEVVLLCLLLRKPINISYVRQRHSVLEQNDHFSNVR